MEINWRRLQVAIGAFLFFTTPHNVALFIYIAILRYFHAFHFISFYFISFFYRLRQRHGNSLIAFTSQQKAGSSYWGIWGKGGGSWQVNWMPFATISTWAERICRHVNMVTAALPFPVSWHSRCQRSVAICKSLLSTLPPLSYLTYPILPLYLSLFSYPSVKLLHCLRSSAAAAAASNQIVVIIFGVKARLGFFPNQIKWKMFVWQTSCKKRKTNIYFDFYKLIDLAAKINCIILQHSSMKMQFSIYFLGQKK